MVEQAEEARKLAKIAADPALTPEVRVRAIELLGNIGTYAALRALLDLAANDALATDHRVLALKKATEIIKPGRGRESDAD